MGLDNLVSKFRSDFVVSSATLISGGILINTVSFLFQPLLRRLFTVEEFGAFSVFTSIVSIGAVVAALSFQFAIYIPKKRKKASGLLLISWITAFITTFGFFLVLLFFRTEFASFINFPKEYTAYLLLLPLSIFLFSINDSLNHWLIREKLIIKTVYNRFGKRLSDAITASVLGLKSITGGLFWGDIFGGLVQSFISFKIFRKASPRLNFERGYLLNNVREFKRYPLLNGGPALLNTLSLAIPVILINSIYSTTNAGYFDMAKILLSVPLAVLSVPISKAILQKFSEKYRNRFPILKLFFSLLVVLGFIAVGIIGLIHFFALPVIEIAFGTNWAPAAPIAEILVYSFALKLVVSPISNCLTAIDKIKAVSAWQIFHFLAILLLVFIKIDLFEQFLRTYVIIEIVVYLIYLLVTLYFVLRYEKSLSN